MDYGPLLWHLRFFLAHASFLAWYAPHHGIYLYGAYPCVYPFKDMPLRVNPSGFEAPNAIVTRELLWSLEYKIRMPTL